MKKILYIAIFALLYTGCDDRLEDLNTDKRNPAEVDPETLFTTALVNTFDMMTSISVNDNPFRLYAQYWAQTTYPDESQYNMTTRNIPRNIWRNAYRDALINFKESGKLIALQLEDGGSGSTDAVLNNRLAVINIMSVYVFSTLVDAFGDVPYSEALNPENLSPRYDDAGTIYSDLVTRLDNAIASTTVASAGFSDAQDLLYGGDMAMWAAFANSLKFRLGMKLSAVDEAASVSIVNSALAAGIITSNEGNASMTYIANNPYQNPVFKDLVLSGRADFVAANTIVDVMNAVDDPRRFIYFRENLGDSTFNGGTYGTANSYPTFTQVGDIFHTPTLPGTILNYAEMEFLMAEAVEVGGYTVTGTAEEHYNAGIQASFDQWGVPETAFATYIAQPDVAYATATGTYQQKIGTQMWLGLYNQGFDAWNYWKKYDFTGFNAAEGLTLEDIPTRLMYPQEEAQLNGEMYDQAAGRITGGDVATVRVFWDEN